MNRNDYSYMDEYLASKIRDARIKRGYSMVDFAHKFNISKQRYFNYETGARSLSLRLFIQMCEALGLDAEQTYKEAQDYMREKVFNADLQEE